MPSPAGRERHGGQERADQGDEERAADPELDVGEAERLDDEEQAHRLGRPDEAGEDDEARQRPEPDRPEDALLEPVVQLEDPMRQRQLGEDLRRPKLRSVSSAAARTTTTPTPIANTIWTSVGSPSRKLQ